MKLVPTTKLIGNFTVSFIIKLTLLLLELFCMPIINNKNKQELNETTKNNFLNNKGIYINIV